MKVALEWARVADKQTSILKGVIGNVAVVRCAKCFRGKRNFPSRNGGWTRAIVDGGLRRIHLHDYSGSCRCVNARPSSNTTPERMHLLVQRILSLSPCLFSSPWGVIRLPWVVMAALHRVQLGWCEQVNASDQKLWKESSEEKKNRWNFWRMFRFYACAYGRMKRAVL